MKFVVAVDGSEQSERTLDYVLDLTDVMAERPAITVVHSVDPEVYTAGGIEPITDLADAEQRLIIENVEDAEDRGWDILHNAREYAAAQGVDVRIELLYGDPVEQIPDFATSEEFDTIFVGHRGHSEHVERLLGSVAKGLVERADRPVTVVR